MHRYRVAVLLVVAAASGRSASAQSFKADTTANAQAALEVGGVQVAITNAVPPVTVPPPHPATVMHLNARLCADADQACRKRADGEVPRGERRCVLLTPTIFAGETVTYTLRKEEVAALVNRDYCALKIDLVSSTQASAWYFPCASQTADGAAVYDPRRAEMFHVRVRGQNSFGFECSFERL